MRYLRLVKPALLSLVFLLLGRTSAEARDREEDSLVDVGPPQQVIMDTSSSAEDQNGRSGREKQNKNSSSSPDSRNPDTGNTDAGAVDPSEAGESDFADGSEGDPGVNDPVEPELESDRASEKEEVPVATPVDGERAAELARQKKLEDAALLERELARATGAPDTKSGCFFSVLGFLATGTGVSYGAISYLI